MKKGFANMFSVTVLLVLLIVFHTYFLHTRSIAYLKKVEKRHIVTLKAFQMTKQLKKEFTTVFLNEKITLQKNMHYYELTLMNQKFILELDAEKGIKIVQTDFR